MDAHGMEPVAVLGSLGVLGGRLPRTLVVGCEPGEINERIGLSEAVFRSVEPAVSVVQELLDREFGLPPPALARSGATTPFPTREEG
jgi:hydrogenase maturation protease